MIPDEELAHHGVVGMKWGVRKQRQLDVYNRVASGSASRKDRFDYSKTLTALDIVKHKGDHQKIASEKASKLQAQKDRFEAGTDTKRDKFDAAMNTTIFEAIRQRRERR